MKDIKSTCRRWEDMETDALVTIFEELNMIEMVPVSQVCRSWRSACADPILWGVLDLGRIKSNFIPTRAPPFVWVDERSDKRLTRVLKIAMTLSLGSVSSIIFHFDLYMKDEHLNYIAERCPDLKRLVLPAWNRITKSGICHAIRKWDKLESMTMPTILNPPYVMEEIGKNCKNFNKLKVMGSFDVNFAASIHANLPGLKVLSVRCSRLSKEALVFLLERMENLEILNVSHCLIVEGPISNFKKVMRGMEGAILAKASRLRKFVHCFDPLLCLSCRRMSEDEGILRWYKYEDWFWRMDEVSSLNLRSHGRIFDDCCVSQVCP